MLMQDMDVLLKNSQICLLEVYITGKHARDHFLGKLRRMTNLFLTQLLINS